MEFVPKFTVFQVQFERYSRVFKPILSLFVITHHCCLLTPSDNEISEGRKIALLAPPEAVNFFILRFSPRATIPTLIVFVTVPIFFAIRFIVGVLITDLVRQCEPIVSEKTMLTSSGDK